MFTTTFIELLALLGSILVFGMIIVASGFVIFIVILILRAMATTLKKSEDKKDGK